MNYDELKRLADEFEKSGFCAPEPYEDDRHYTMNELVYLEYLKQTAPCHVKALISENDRLKREEKNDAIAYRAAIERQEELRVEIDQLKAENEALKRERTDWQAECLKKGFEYVREPDAHYVLADVPEMAALLADLLGVEVRSKDNDDYGETVSSLSEQMEACNSVYGRAYDLEKENEALRNEIDSLTEQYVELQEAFDIEGGQG